MYDKLKIALSGNPNVGKSTVFNALTGLKQHTGNWSGKTVEVACGNAKINGTELQIIDLPGTYSLTASGDEEEIARNFMCFEDYDAAVIVCDATTLERNLILVLQTLEITRKAVVCINMMDEAQKKGISIDREQLQKRLGVPVVLCSARNKHGIDELIRSACRISQENPNPLRIKYSATVENAAQAIENKLITDDCFDLPTRFCSLRLIDDEEVINTRITEHMSKKAATEISDLLNLYKSDSVKEAITGTIVGYAEKLAKCCIKKSAEKNLRDRKIDRIITGKYTAVPIMLLSLALILFITMYAANYPSELLTRLFAFIQAKLEIFLGFCHVPSFVTSLICDGIFKTVAWVIAVMFPPMAIFFPLFTILEDVGFLPRIAFNLDRYFKRADACGKQALTMCMGFGCNAVGVTGCRIIESKRERTIAQLTNNFAPCNGRFPTLIAIITMFIVSGSYGIFAHGLSAIVLTLIIVTGIIMTFIVSWALSKTLLRGTPSSFVLELPPYRKPQFGRIIVTSLLNRSLFVLGRALIVAAPAGLVIWLLANTNASGISLLQHISSFLDPFARIIGLDGVILLAFILGFPANEIVIPIIIMAYTGAGQLLDISDLSVLRELLVSNGWTMCTAVCTMLFSLMHWPCSTTCITIYKETKSLKKTALAILIPTVCGVTVCTVISTLSRLL